MSIFTTIFGDENSAFIKKAMPIVARINGLEESMSLLPDSGLKEKTAEFKRYVERVL